MLVLILHVFVGMRPAVASAPWGVAEERVVANCHDTGESAPSRDVQAAPSSHADHHGAAPVAPSSHVPLHDEPTTPHPSHHDSGCHGAPCCAPVLPAIAVGLPTSTSVLLGFRRPLSGAARIIWADGARRLPPSTAPPASTLV
jgi:hypothetical protein